MATQRAEPAKTEMLLAATGPLEEPALSNPLKGVKRNSDPTVEVKNFQTQPPKCETGKNLSFETLF